MSPVPLSPPPGGDGLCWLRSGPGEAGGRHEDALHRARSVVVVAVTSVVVVSVWSRAIDFLTECDAVCKMMKKACLMHQYLLK